MLEGSRLLSGRYGHIRGVYRRRLRCTRNMAHRMPLLRIHLIFGTRLRRIIL